MMDLRYYKSPSGDVYAYEQEQVDAGAVKPGLVEMTAAEIAEHLSPRPTLTEVKARRSVEVDSLYLAVLAAGMSYGGKTLQLRPEDQQNIAAMAQRAALSQAGTVPWPADFAWRMADNSFLPLPTPADMIAMAAGAADEVLRLRRVAWGHKDAIDALTDAAAVEAYNITAGWD